MQNDYEDENEYINLPDDPEHGFAILQRRQFAKLQEDWDDPHRGWDNERNYVETLVAYDKINCLGILDNFHKIPLNDSEFSDFFYQFRQFTSYQTKEILAQHARRAKLTETSIIELDETAKSAIHSFIRSIRHKLSEISIDDKKRSSLLKKLYAFELELDLGRTRTEAFYHFTIDMIRMGRDVSEEIQPILQTTDRVFDLFDRAKKIFDYLPPWKEKKQISGPTETSSPETIDDDIPF